MRRIFIYQLIFLFLVCIPIHGMNEQNISKDIIQHIIPYAGLAASYNWACTCKYYWNIINPDGSLSKKFSDIVKKMDIDTYTKEMICLARSENINMFYWLKDNTNEKNRKETEYIVENFNIPFPMNNESVIKHILNMDEKENYLATYATTKYIETKVQHCIDANRFFPFIRLLIHQGFNINYQWTNNFEGYQEHKGWKNGDTLLHFLAYGITPDCKDSINFLLNHPEIDVNIQNDEGQTPLHIMIYDKKVKFDWESDERLSNYFNTNKFNCMQQLLKHPKLLIDVKDKEGNTQLDIVYRYGNHDIYQCFCENFDNMKILRDFKFCSMFILMTLLSSVCVVGSVYLGLRWLNPPWLELLADQFYNFNAYFVYRQASIV